MKLAYLFHGHSRTWDRCYQSFFNNLYSVAPGDIFIHTWDTVNAITGSHWNGWNDLQGEHLELSKKKIDATGISQAYQPKCLIIDQHPEVDISWCEFSDVTTKANYAVKHMLYSSRKAFEVAKEYDEYDVYFDLRMDIYFDSGLDINELFSGKLMTAKGMNTDLFMFGNKSLMDTKTGYYYDVEDYWYKNERFKTTGYEAALISYLAEKGIHQGSGWTESNLNWRCVRLF